MPETRVTLEELKKAVVELSDLGWLEINPLLDRAAWNRKMVAAQNRIHKLAARIREERDDA